MEKIKILKEVSFITTVFNEEKSVILFLDSLTRQTVMPGEIIIVDGGSSDDTLNVILEYFSKIYDGNSLQKNISINNGMCHQNDNPSYKSYRSDKSYISEKLLLDGYLTCGTEVKIFYAEHTKISQGRNIAIKNSKGSFICISDGGCRLDSNWLYEITKYYFPTIRQSVDGNDIDAIGGYNYPYAKRFLQALLSMCILPKKSEIEESKFMPSSRNFSFKRQVWEAVGGYPENMDYGEDMKFNFNLKKGGYRIKFNPDAQVFWNLRDNLKAIFKQFFRYAKGDAIGSMYLHRHLIRFFTLLVSLIIVAVSAVFSPWYLLLLLPLFMVYTYKQVFRISYMLDNQKSCVFIKNKRQLQIFKFLSVFSIPLLLIYIDIAKMLGYIYGLAVRKKY
jgi:glycosyltransferase involved in cell wall biosynthesis